MVDRGSFSNIMNDLSFIDERVRCHAPLERMTPLPTMWKPDNWSVICGRGRDAFDHVGNRRFRILVDINLEKYSKARTKLEKSMIVVGILDVIRDGSEVGGFVKHDPKAGRYFEVGDEVAREKIGQQFRTALAARQKEKKTKTKKTKRPSVVVSAKFEEKRHDYCQSKQTSSVTCTEFKEQAFVTVADCYDFGTAYFNQIEV